jgi:hypothetical protein
VFVLELELVWCCSSSGLGAEVADGAGIESGAGVGGWN